MKKYIKNNEIKSSCQIVCRITEQVEIDGVMQDVEYSVYNPSEKMILADGWQPYDNRAEEYEERVIALVRQRYTVNQELAILRQRDTKPEEFDEYNAYVEQCKATARKEVWDESAS